MPRFPTRTLILMTLALFAFVFMWWQTHRAQPAAPAPVNFIVIVDGGAP